MAAGSLMVTEAGGRVTNFKGGRFSIRSREILATNGHVHNEMVEVLKLGKPRRGRIGIKEGKSKKMFDKLNRL